ncbi:Ribosomal protein S20 [Candidatus Magnetomorum sp. HK-1]|nr:Ribosomal protein S20 [Candidatus Magnetomorum sp. HK-1]
MANHKSALKRAKQNILREGRNKSTKTSIKNVIKKVLAAIEEKSKTSASAAMVTAQSVIDKASKQGVIHKRSASRKISRLTSRINQLASA